MKTTATASPEVTELEDSALNELFVDELKDIYWAEKHLSKALPKMIKGATSEELKSTIQAHLTETENHITRLEQVFSSIGEKAVAVKCEAMAGLLKEGEEIMGETEKGTLTRDVGIISAAQKVEHYEIASYGTLKTLAAVLGYIEAAGLLEETLAEEKNADSLLTQVAESAVNSQAKTEKK
jgi:ferritin-like metal-binding protein YciE